MKKLFSITLVVAMLFTMVLPMSVSAVGEGISISKSAPTIIEAEDILVTDSGYATLTNADASGESTNNVIAGQITGSSSLVVASTTITVTESGFYDVEYVASDYARHSNPNYFSQVRFYLATEGGSSKQIAGTVNQNVTDTLDGKYTGMKLGGSTIVMSKFCDKAYIEAGTYTFNVNIRYNTAGSYRSIIDYIKFSASANPQVSKSSGTTIEFDDIETTGVGTVQTSTSTSDDYLRISTTSAPNFDSTINVTETGYYDIEYVVGTVGAAGAAYISPINLSLVPAQGDAITIGGNPRVTGQAAEYTTNDSANYGAMLRYAKNMVKLEEGNYDLGVAITIASQRSKYWCIMDNIKITPIAHAQLSDTAPLTIEFDEIEPTGLGTVQTSTDGNNDYLKISTASVPEFVCTIDVATTGYYDIEYVVGTVGAAGTAYISDIALSLGEISIGNNPKNTDQELAYEIDSTTSANYGKMYKYVKEKVLIEAGTYDLGVVIGTASQRSKYWCIMDNITFTASEEEEEPNADTVIAFADASYDVVVTSALNEGTAKVIWVAYDANDKMTSYAISAAFDLVNVGTIPVVVPGTFNAASGTKWKAMLWVDEVNCQPLTASINK